MIGQDFKGVPGSKSGTCDLVRLQKTLIAAKLMGIDGVPYLILPSTKTRRGGTKDLKGLLEADSGSPPMMRTMFLKSAPILVLALLLSACSFMGIGESEFSCRGGSTDGVRCLSARKVYEATERSDQVVPVAGPDGTPTEAPIDNPASGSGGGSRCPPSTSLCRLEARRG